MKTRNFRDLIVWQRAMALTRACYAIARQLPPEERFALGAQLRRAAISVPANIAEGHASRHRRQFLRYLGIAHASLMEIECHLLIAVDVGHLPEAAISDALSLREETSRMLRAMRRALGESIAER
ncbi:MAG: four helix bundle protein [Gemmatirosa sp.]